MLQCIMRLWGRVRGLAALISARSAYCEPWHSICMRVWSCTHVILYCWSQASNLLPLSSSSIQWDPRPPTPFLHQAYLALPFILVRRRSARQKETSAQWENALIIHDHLTIQYLVCVAYVAFLISVCQADLLMAVSFRWFLYTAPPN